MGDYKVKSLENETPRKVEEHKKRKGKVKLPKKRKNPTEERKERVKGVNDEGVNSFIQRISGWNIPYRENITNSKRTKIEENPDGPLCNKSINSNSAIHIDSINYNPEGKETILVSYI